MNRSRWTATIGTAILGIALATAGGAATALAAPAPLASVANSIRATPQGCPNGEHYYTYDSHRYFLVKKGDKTTGPGGIELTLSVSGKTTIYGKIVASGSYSVNDLISAAKAQITVTISYSKTDSVSQGAKFKVPSKWKLGWLGWGAWGYEFKWQRGHYQGNCNFVEDRHGTAKLPAKTTGFDDGKGAGPGPS